jgi:hypothetical protein
MSIHGDRTALAVVEVMIAQQFLSCGESMTDERALRLAFELMNRHGSEEVTSASFLAMLAEARDTAWEIGP